MTKLCGKGRVLFRIVGQFTHFTDLIDAGF